MECSRSYRWVPPCPPDPGRIVLKAIAQSTRTAGLADRHTHWAFRLLFSFSVYYLVTFTPAFSRSHVRAVTPASFKRYFCTRSVGVFGRASMNSTYLGTAK